MSTEALRPDVDNWQPLAPIERRVIGVLVEKQKTSRTADAYPMTLNSITTGCNQKSNREPVMDLSEDEVEDTLTALQKKLLVTRVTGSRVDRFRHMLYENWNVDKTGMAVLAELLLRGPQTKGELRGRASRMDPIDTLEALEAVLRTLVERKLVVYLTDPDRRGAMLTHGFHTPDELSHAQTFAAHETSVASEKPTPRISAPNEFETKFHDAMNEMAALKAAVANLEQQLADVRRHLGMA